MAYLHRLERARLQLPRFGVLATQARGELEGYPSGSVVEYAADDKVSGCVALGLPPGLRMCRGDVPVRGKHEAATAASGWDAA